MTGFKTGNIKAYIALLRPLQWFKNVFVFLPMLFGGFIFDIHSWINSFLGFIIFSLGASAVYCLNDSVDYINDRGHALKKARPVASGKISPFKARCIALFIVMLDISLILFLGWMDVLAIMLVYWGLNVLYTYRIKYYAIIDVVIIALGFVLRVLVGGSATNIWISPWMICMTFLLTLFLAFTKRRGDVKFQEITGEIKRRSVAEYNLSFIDVIITMLATVTVVSYFLFTMSEDVVERTGTENLYITSLFVLLGIIRYLQIIYTKPFDGLPTRTITRDPFIIGCTFFWILSYLLIIY